MTIPNDPAFPLAELPDNDRVAHGLTIREDFAARIMAGFAADSRAADESPERLASRAVRCTDALIAALNAPTGSVSTRPSDGINREPVYCHPDRAGFSTARLIATDVMTYLGRDPSDFRLRDRVISHVSPWIEKELIARGVLPTKES